jgi:hypothetical protein
MLEQLVQEKTEVTCIEMHYRGGILGSQKPVWIDGDLKTLQQIETYLSELVLDNNGLVGYECWFDSATGIHSLGVQEIYYDQENISRLQKFLKRIDLVEKIELENESSFTRLKVQIAALFSGYNHFPYAFPRHITDMLEKALFHNRILSSTDRAVLLEKLIPEFPEIKFNLEEVNSFGDIAF